MVRYLWAMGAAAALALTMASAAFGQQGGARMFVRLEVVDYKEWRKIYDGFDSARKAAGITTSTVWQSPDDPSEVTIINDFPTLDQAKAFAASGDLQNAMRDAGLKSPPQVWFAVQAR